MAAQQSKGREGARGGEWERGRGGGALAVAFNTTFIIKQHKRHKEATQTHAPHTHTCTHTNAYTWAYTHTQTHTNILTHTHTHTERENKERQSEAESYTAAFMSALNGC